MISSLRFSGQAASVATHSRAVLNTDSQPDAQASQTDEQPADRFSPSHSGQQVQETEENAGILIRNEDALLSQHGAKRMALKEFFGGIENLGTTLSIPIHHHHRPDVARIARLPRLQETIAPVALNESVRLSERNIADIERLVTNDLMQRIDLRSTVNALQTAMLIGILGPMANSLPDDAAEIRRAVRNATDDMRPLIPASTLEEEQHSPARHIQPASHFVSEFGDREPANAHEIRAAIKTAIDERTAQAKAEDREPTWEELAKAGARAAQSFFNPK